jgi:hypothetical protein
MLMPMGGLDRARTTCVKKHHQKRVMDGECTDDESGDAAERGVDRVT